MEKYIMALDQGTTSSRCILYDRKGRIKSLAQREFRQYYPENGWVEHDPQEIWSTQMSVAQEAMYKINATYENIEAIGITNQRETTIVWDKDTGIPIYNAIVWQCRRTAAYCDWLKKQPGLEDRIKEKTGLIIDAYFSGTKLKWILDNVEGAREKAEKGQLLFGTVETWLIWKLTGGRAHVTDYSNASRTMMFNIHELCWDNELLELLDIPEAMLPDPRPSSCIYGYTEKHIFGKEIPVAGAAGDQQAALFGQTCFDEGESKMTFGTGGFMLMNTGQEPLVSRNGLLTTIAYGLDGKVFYALEGSVFVAGAAVQWIRDELEIIPDAPATQKMAMSVKDTEGVVVVPAFVGLGAPYWEPHARGSIFGITRGTNKNHIARAVLESIAYQTKDLLDAMEEDMGRSMDSLKVDGGAAANDFLLQFQADILDKKVIRPSCVESTSLGAAYFAGLATGCWDSAGDIKNIVAIDREFAPAMDENRRQEHIRRWKRAVKAARYWAKDMTSTDKEGR